MNKISELQTIINIHQPLFVSIVESWLSDTFLSEGLGLTNYNIFRRDRGARGGGVMLAVHCNFVSRQVTGITLSETLAVDITIKPNYALRVITSYNPQGQNSKQMQTVLNDISDLITLKSDYIILADLNIDYHSLYICNTQQSHILLSNFINDHYPITQLVDFGTRGNKTIDYIFCNNANLIKQLTNLPEIGNSDHVTIKGVINLSTNYNTEKRYVYFKDFKNADYIKLNEVLILLLTNFKIEPLTLLYENFKNVLKIFLFLNGFNKRDL